MIKRFLPGAGVDVGAVGVFGPHADRLEGDGAGVGGPGDIAHGRRGGHLAARCGVPYRKITIQYHTNNNILSDVFWRMCAAV